MKRILIAGAALLLFSCSSNEKKEEKAAESSSGGGIIENVGNLSKMSGAADKMEELGKKLKGLTPLTNAELKAVVPETLNGLKRKSFSAGGAAVSGVSTIEAEYGVDDNSKTIKVMIMDGAGETGSAVISLLSMTLSMDTESEADGKVTKTTEINGVRTQTEDSKSEQSANSSIKFLYKDRYSVSLDGNGYSLSELESFKKALDLSALK